MVKVSKITVRSFSLDYVDVFWEILPVAAPVSDSKPHEIWDYDFYVLRSQAATGPFETIGGPWRDTYLFRDALSNSLTRGDLFYKVKVVNRVTGEEEEFGPSSNVQPEPDLIASQIIRLEDVIFRELIGRKCILYPIRHFGPACSCYDVITRRKTRGNHLPCFGTGWLGGFLSPVQVYIQIDPNTKTTSKTSLGDKPNGITTARMISFPPAHEDDIIIEAENKRWKVKAVSQTQRLRATVHQELQLVEIPKGAVEYSLPVKLDASELEPSAERNFSNPHNTDQSGNYEDIFTVYGFPRGSIK